MERPILTGKKSYGERYDYAMQITNEAEAKSYFDDLVEYHLRNTSEPRTREEVERIERSNLGYYAGYYSSETYERVARLFGSVHPIYGGNPFGE